MFRVKIYICTNRYEVNSPEKKKKKLLLIKMLENVFVIKVLERKKFLSFPV